MKRLFIFTAMVSCFAIANAGTKLPVKGIANMNVSKIAATLKSMPANATTAADVRASIEQKADKNAESVSCKSIEIKK